VIIIDKILLFLIDAHQIEIGQHAIINALFNLMAQARKVHNCYLYASQCNTPAKPTRLPETPDLAAARHVGALYRRA